MSAPNRVIVEQVDGALYAWYDEGQCDGEPGKFYVPETLVQKTAEMAALLVLASHHRCRLKKDERRIPAGTPCDMCIEDSKYFAQYALGAIPDEAK